jgi:MOSC domain-containing protein YiiM
MNEAASAKVISVNVGVPRDVMRKGELTRTAIYKDPVSGPVPIRKLNLAGDRQADPTVHGGVNKAVYGYPVEHYSFWRAELPELDFPLGAFGENLTMHGLSEDTLCIGDTVRVGTAVLMVTQPRSPCYKLALRFDRDNMVKLFLASGRTGFYFSVIEEGYVEAGAPVEVLTRDPNQVTVTDIVRLYRHETADADLVRRVLTLPTLADKWKSRLETRAASKS